MATFTFRCSVEFLGLAKGTKRNPLKNANFKITYLKCARNMLRSLQLDETWYEHCKGTIETI